MCGTRRRAHSADRVVVAETADSSVRLALLAAVSAAAREITAALYETQDGPAVTVALDGDEIRIDITRAPETPAAPPA